MSETIELALDGTDATNAVLDSLHDWLENEELDDVTVEFAHGKPVAGKMGVDPIAALTVVLGSKAAVDLFRSVRAWIKERKPKLVMKVKTRAGTVEIDAENVPHLDNAIEQTLRLLKNSK